MNIYCIYIYFYIYIYNQGHSVVELASSETKGSPQSAVLLEHDCPVWPTLLQFSSHRGQSKPKAAMGFLPHVTLCGASARSCEDTRLLAAAPMALAKPDKEISADLSSQCPPLPLIWQNRPSYYCIKITHMVKLALKERTIYDRTRKIFYGRIRVVLSTRTSIPCVSMPWGNCARELSSLLSEILGRW